jgi:hypothetical protein
VDCTLYVLDVQGLSVNNGADASTLSNLTAALLQLPDLQVLNVSYSMLGSSLPAAWSSLQKLRVLDISRTSTWGNPTRSLPSQWCNMTSLQVLRAEETGLGGSLDALPVAGACMPSLRVLLLGGNRYLVGNLPPGALKAADLKACGALQAAVSPARLTKFNMFVLSVS